MFQGNCRNEFKKYLLRIPPGVTSFNYIYYCTFFPVEGTAGLVRRKRSLMVQLARKFAKEDL